MSPIPMHLTTHSNLESKRLATMFSLSDLAVFDVTGADAVSFLQGQITNDIAGASFDRARLAGYCTAQGRLLATMVLSHAKPLENGTPVLCGIIKRDIVLAVLKRLSMFVMRSKAKLTESHRLVQGICLNQVETTDFESLIGFKLPTKVWEKLDTDLGTWIAAPSTSLPRWWLISNTSQTAAVEALLINCSVGNLQDWHAMDIAEGLPWIEATTQDLFIPQTLNLDLIQGVSFTKGCYPGQEIVARSHYRGTVKRRMVSAVLLDHHNQGIAERVDATLLPALTPGADIYDGSREDQVCGRIINVALTETNTYLLIESSFEAVDHAKLRAMSPNGPALRLEPLPYSVRQDSSEK